jgi:hypothetical protein
LVASGIPTLAESPDKVKLLSLQWLKQGCVSVVVMETTPKSFTKEQEILAISVSTWLNGFITGANSMCLANTEADKTSPLFYPPQEWTDARKLAPKILSFLDSHPEIPSSATCREVMMAFYYSTHPKRTEFHLAIASGLIADMGKQ